MELRWFSLQQQQFVSMQESETRYACEVRITLDCLMGLFSEFEKCNKDPRTKSQQVSQSVSPGSSAKSLIMNIHVL